MPRQGAPVLRSAYGSRRLLARLWRDYLSAHKWTMAAAGVFMVIEGSTLGALSWMLKPLFDRGFVAGEGRAIWWVGGAIFSLFLIRALTLIVNRALLTRVGLRSATAMQVELLGHLLTLDGPFYQENPPGALIERVQGDTAVVQGVWSLLITGIGRDVIALASLFGVAVDIDPLWTLTALVAAPLLILPTIALQRYLHPQGPAGHDDQARRQPAEGDRPGSDSYRLFHEGKSEGALLVGPGTHALFVRHPEESDPVTLALRHFEGADLVLVEGWETAALPKIEVFRTETGPRPLLDPAGPNAAEWIALVTDDDRLDAS